MGDASEFVLVSNWRVHASRERVWQVLRATREWPAWWRYVASVDEIEPGDERGVGALQRYRWTSRLPYGVTFAIRTTEVRRAERRRYQNRLPFHDVNPAEARTSIMWGGPCQVRQVS